MIVCGWCGHPTRSRVRCDHCMHTGPSIPWEQRGQTAPVVDAGAEHRRSIALAEADLRAEGIRPTVERIAERLDISPRTVRRWREVSA